MERTSGERTSGHPCFFHLHAINIRGLGFRVEFLVKIGGGGFFESNFLKLGHF
jgi:hypothetical protein